jgi:hypothetical protein
VGAARTDVPDFPLDAGDEAAIPDSLPGKLPESFAELMRLLEEKSSLIDFTQRPSQ